MNTDFDSIYANGGWNGLGSGPGSTPGFTAGFRKVFQAMLSQIGSVLEIGCGDWQWQRLINWEDISYIGTDVVASVIQANQKQFPHVFSNADLFKIARWPTADLLLVKDLVHHISHDNIRRLKAESKFFRRVLWVVDMEGDRICNWPADLATGKMKHIYEFDLTVENYPFGRKVTLIKI